ncbi:Transcriptional regulator, AraC family protein [Shigella dysenteriae WRSd3]|uniref:Transcriptional regulator, AraC family protein n=2 Tax=Shigella dysenteriae TaxID=622 RepID=A0A090NYH2_SHIDY|nr:Transcriptional regulator, AraC family protein [Shigella dysenteriae 1617]ESU81258.1 Transcriptional regulator, AraC family protein [Shigella dysenteriae WRSd3]ESU83660.1 Transcriptional regulator, AraC family protein [Shigella dysenteriae WRSd5]
MHPARQIQLPSLQRGEGEAMLTALTHLSRSPLEQNIIQPLVLSLLHLCRNVVNMPPSNSQPRGDFLYHSICNWVQDNYAQPLTRESVAQFFNITPNHLSKLFAQHGTMRFIEYVRWVRMAKARMILQKYHLSIHEVAQRCGFPDSDYFCRVFRRQFGLTPGEYSARFQG